ncbi:amino acid transporter [Microbacterium sp. BWT-B31]|uniref:amino acid transporter n=1 Tax=Microbacterium sp. BWT-B31 TaxID=3232072 RepID=UPI0035289FD8
MNERPTRRDLMKPVQLLGLAFGSAVFAGVVTLISMGFFQSRFDGQSQRALVVAGVIAGITFIAVLVILALLLLAVDPAQVQKPVDRGVLVDKGDADATAPKAQDEGPDATLPGPAGRNDPPRG